MGTRLVRSQSGNLTFEATLHEYNAALTTLRALGVPISPHGRLESYRKTLATMVGAADIGLLGITGHLRAEVSVALAEATEINDIARAFHRRPTDAFMERLRILGKGERDPDDDLHTKARDAQFELWLASMIRVNGVKVRAGTPDLNLKTPFGRLFLEAKRLTSEARFDDRLHEAVTTLGKTGEYGAVMVSIDQIVRPRHQVAWAADQKALERHVMTVFSAFADRHERDVKLRTTNTRVAAIVLSLRLPAALGLTRQHGVYQSLHVWATSPAKSPGLKALNWVVELVRRTNLPA